MRRALVPLLALLLTACNTVEEIPKDPIVESGTVIENPQEDPSDDRADELRNSYEQAEKVLVIVRDQIDKQQKQILSGAIQTFEEDLEALQYYVDLADREPLLEKDREEVSRLSRRIEDAMTLFSAVLDLL